MIKLYPHQEQSLKETEKFNRVAYYLEYGRDVTFEIETVSTSEERKYGNTFTTDDFTVKVGDAQCISSYIHTKKKY